MDRIKTIGGYEVQRCIGRGGMGVVYEATTTDGRPVALKLMRANGSDDRTRMLVSRFLREARVLRRLQHRGIVKLYSAGIVDGYVYLALERIHGVSLRMVHELRPLNLSTLVWLGAEIASTIAHLHRAGVLHRDVKPSNVLIDEEGLPRLIDFGISTYMGATCITKKNDVLGTLGYIAPEALEGEMTQLADQYSLGRMLISLASPTPRAERVCAKTRFRRILDGMQINWTAFPDGGRWPLLQMILQRMVADPPDRRFEDMTACTKALQSLSQSVGSVEQARQIARAMAKEAKKRALEAREEISLVTADPAWLESIADQRDVETAVIRPRPPEREVSLEGPCKPEGRAASVA